MGWFDNILVNNPKYEKRHVPEYEHFPTDTYGVAYPVSIYKNDLTALRELVDAESLEPTTIGKARFLSEIVGAKQPLRTAGKELTPAVRELIKTWESQLDTDPTAVWWSDAIEWRVDIYLHYCEERAEHENDAFEFPESIDRVHAFLDRCQAAQENEAKRALVHKDKIPAETPGKR